MMALGVRLQGLGSTLLKGGGGCIGDYIRSMIGV